jgi:hypothetical protein
MTTPLKVGADGLCDFDELSLPQVRIMIVEFLDCADGHDYSADAICHRAVVRQLTFGMYQARDGIALISNAKKTCKGL